jgi:CHAT domain-containing protein
VHIASHFDLRAGDESNSFLLLGGTTPQGQHLTLTEIENDEYDFHGTDLLTLSACDTAMGGAGDDGDEVDGLGMLAQLKGASAVVASLWSVDDESTGRLMEEFYRRWTANPGTTSKAEALRQAQLMMLRGELGTGDTTAGASAASKSSPAQKSTARGVRLNSSATPASSQYSHPYYWAPFILIGNWR